MQCQDSTLEAEETQLSRLAMLRGSGHLGNEDLNRLGRELGVPIVVLVEDASSWLIYHFGCQDHLAKLPPVFLFFQAGQTENGNHFDWIHVPDAKAFMASLRVNAREIDWKVAGPNPSPQQLASEGKTLPMPSLSSAAEDVVRPELRTPEKGAGGSGKRETSSEKINAGPPAVTRIAGRPRKSSAAPNQQASVDPPPTTAWSAESIGSLAPQQLIYGDVISHIGGQLLTDSGHAGFALVPVEKYETVVHSDGKSDARFVEYMEARPLPNALVLLLNPNGNHWSMAVVDFDSGCVDYHDSMYEYLAPIPIALKRQLFRRLKMLEANGLIRKMRWKWNRGASVLQDDHYSCGACTLINLEAVLYQKPYKSTLQEHEANAVRKLCVAYVLGSAPRSALPHFQNAIANAVDVAKCTNSQGVVVLDDADDDEYASDFHIDCNDSDSENEDDEDTRMAWKIKQDTSTSVDVVDEEDGGGDESDSASKSGAEQRDDEDENNEDVADADAVADIGEDAASARFEAEAADEWYAEHGHQIPEDLRDLFADDDDDFVCDSDDQAKPKQKRAPLSPASMAKQQSVYSKGLRARNKLQQKFEDDNTPTPYPPLLHSVIPRNHFVVGMEFLSRKAVIVAVLALCEATGNLPLQTKTPLAYKATTHGKLKADQKHLKIKAKYNRASGRWVVTEFVPPSPKIEIKARGKRRSKSCAYAATDLACLVQALVKQDPAVKGRVLRTVLQQYVKYELTGKMLNKIRYHAYERSFGNADNRIQFLQAYVDKLKAAGHSAKVEHMNGMRMCDALMAYKQHVHTITQRVHAAKLGRLPKESVLESDIVRKSRAMWQKKTWKVRKGELLLDPRHQREIRGIRHGNQKYFSAVYYIPASAKAAAPHIAKLIQMDGCCGKGRGSMYNHMYVVGLSSNDNIIPLLYSIVLGNESNRTWEGVLDFLQQEIPELSDGLFTALVDGDKGMIHTQTTIVFKRFKRHQIDSYILL
jgi:hypothetical protein